MGNDKPSARKQQIKPYELERIRTMAENSSRLNAIGVRSLVSKELQKKCEQVATSFVNENCSSNEDMNEPRQPMRQADLVQMDVSNTRCRKKKQPAVQKLPMAEYLKSKAQERLEREKQAELSQQLNLIHEHGPRQIQHQKLTCQQEILKRKQEKLRLSSNHGKNEKNYCPPRSYSRYLQVMKGQSSRGQQSIDAELESLEAELLRFSEGLRQVENVGNFAEDASNNQNEVASENDVLVEPVNQRNIRRRTALPQNEVASEDDVLVEPVNQRNVRGRTVLEAIHNRDLEHRDPIVLNDRHQVVGPNKAVVRTFKNFVGTVAKNANLAPLNYVSWLHVPDKMKENIWEYIQRRYIVPEEGRKKVLGKISCIWRQNKCRLKAVHYSNFKTTEERLQNMPDTVPEPQWKELMLYWDTKEANDISERNKDNRSKQDDMHTMGLISYAELRHDLQQNDPNKKEPSLTDMYMNSRKRKVGHTYSTSNEKTLQNIEKMEALTAQDDQGGTSDPYHKVITKKEHSGRLRLHRWGVTKSNLKKNASTPYVLPSVFVDSITQALEKKMESKMAYMFSKILEANPGKNIVIPNFETMEEDASSPHDNIDESSDQTHPS